MKTFLVDLENTKSSGLVGVNKLEEEDVIYAFYSSNVDTITIETHMNIVASRAKFQPIKLDRPGKNALDFQLITFLGYLIGETKIGQYYIISRDLGFQYAVNFCMNYLKKEDVFVKRADSIDQVLNIRKNIPEERSKLMQQIQPIKDDLVASPSVNKETAAENEDQKKEDRQAGREEAALRSFAGEEGRMPETQDTAHLEMLEDSQKPVDMEEAVEEQETPIWIAMRRSFDENQYEKYSEGTEKLFEKSTSKQAFYRSMTKAFGSTCGRELYTLLKGDYESMKQSRCDS